MFIQSKRKKRETRRSPVEVCETNRSHEVLNSNATIVAVCVDLETTQTLVVNISFSEGVSNNTIAGLEANLGLEGVLSNGTNHLEGNIWAIEQTCVIRRRTLITNDIILVTSTCVSRSQVSSIWVDVDSVLTLENTSEGVTSCLLYTSPSPRD